MHLVLPENQQCRKFSFQSRPDINSWTSSKFDPSILHPKPNPDYLNRFKLHMKHDKKYLFTSERLGFRNWETADIDEMVQINTDEKVMEFFPGLSTRAQTMEFVERMKTQFIHNGFCYFAVDILENCEFIGFIGLSEQNYVADFTPCVDIGWRLKRSAWNRGFATEGAKKCLEFALNDLKLKTIYAIAPKINVKSIHIMAKIGLKQQYEFEHPLLKNDDRLKTCVLYRTE